MAWHWSAGWSRCTRSPCTSVAFLDKIDDGLWKGRVAQGVQYLTQPQQERLKVLLLQRLPDDPDRKALEDTAEQLHGVQLARSGRAAQAMKLSDAERKREAAALLHLRKTKGTRNKAGNTGGASRRIFDVSTEKELARTLG